tara:strand:+ start:50 stop:715 length:666 start_codon:yes stop_codon:yes gene_type:complete
MNNIFLFIGPGYNEKRKFIKSLEINENSYNFKNIFIVTNDINNKLYFLNTKYKNNIIYYEHKEKQVDCCNFVLRSLQEIKKNQDIEEEDILIICHEDCFINDIKLFNVVLNNMKKYDLICREYPDKRYNRKNYIMNDIIFLKKKILKNSNINLLTQLPNIKFQNYCEGYLTENIWNKCNNKLKISYTHCTKGDTELGFYHEPSNGIIGKKWDKKNINNIFS